MEDVDVYLADEQRTSEICDQFDTVYSVQLPYDKYSLDDVLSRRTFGEEDSVFCLYDFHMLTDAKQKEFSRRLSHFVKKSGTPNTIILTDNGEAHIKFTPQKDKELSVEYTVS
jgi:hypothetical protein